MAKAKKPMTAVPVTTTDITLVLNGDTLSANLSPETEWAGIHRLDPQEGFIESQRHFTDVHDLKVTSCQTHGSGSYQAWSSDFDYDIHLSNVIIVP